MGLGINVDALEQRQALATLLAWTGPTLGGVHIDCSLQERHTRGAEVTDHPIETGSAISDHRMLKPLELELEGFISGLPVLASERDQFEIDGDDALSRYEELEKLFASASTFDVITFPKVYTSMVFASLVMERAPGNGGAGAIYFRATMKQITYADAQTVAVVPRALASKKQGQKPPAEAGGAGATARESLLSKGLNSKAVGGASGVRDALNSLSGALGL